MNFVLLIEAKRDGQPLSSAQIGDLVRDYTAGRVPDYQMAAWLMAVYFRGLGEAEVRALTLAMRDSGEVLEFPRDSRPLVDKHSTGGVGDKISLVLTPLLACLGFRVPMISGRGLGITGGTLDKLESIPGFQTSLPRERIVEIVQEVGCVICGQTETMVPADKRLYALRDVTATVPGIPLIVASILSKKLAEQLDALILDVKFGAAAFMPALDRARELARAMETLGNQCGVNTRALLSRMDAPLGRAAGNWLEVKEAVSLLGGSTGDRPPSPHPCEDVLQLVVNCAAHLLVQTGKSASLSAAAQTARECLASGRPLKKWDQMLQAQGADVAWVYARFEKERRAPAVTELRATSEGFVSRCDARRIGEVVRDLGGGRLAKDARIDSEAGVDLIAKPGDFVRSGSILARIHAGDAALAQTAKAGLASAFAISADSVTLPPLVAEVVGA